MTQNEFIFSSERRHRIVRHLTFWLVWCLAYNLLFHFPNHVFKGWDTSGPGTINLQKLGPVLFFIKSFFVNSLLGVIIPQIALTYTLINWLLPEYYLKKRNPLVTGALTLSVLAIFFVVAVLFKHSPAIYNYLADIGPLYPFFEARGIRAVIIDQLSSLPIITGIAVMIKLVKRWWQKHKEAEQLAKEKTNAELRLLKAQVHPHFLFNTLNNIYFFTLSNSPKAPEMITKLSRLLHYILNDCNRPFVLLEKEIDMIRDYMELEKMRYGEQLNMTVEVPANFNNQRISPLLLIPFVENCFKHGTSKVLTRPSVTLRISVEENMLHFFISNSRPAATETSKYKGNIGLKNVRKRLELVYPENHTLSITPGPEIFIVDLKIKLLADTRIDLNREETQPMTAYALA